MDEAQIRLIFENLSYQEYLFNRSKLPMNGDLVEGPHTKEEIFWRQENGHYGVRQLDLAWEGFKMAAAFFTKQTNTH